MVELRLGEFPEELDFVKYEVMEMVCSLSVDGHVPPL